jgi:RNA polymerase sigma factor (sigma-70 family)
MSAPPVNTDLDLVNRCAAGDQTAAGQLVDKYDKLIRFVLWKMQVRPEDIEDVVQNVWMDAWRQIRAGHFRGDEGSFASWLGQIVRGKALDLRRKRKRELPVAAAADEPLGQFGTVASGANQEAVVLAGEAMATLPVRLQMVFWLHYHRNWPVARIANRMGLSKTRTHALVKQARELFSRTVLGRKTIGQTERLSLGRENDPVRRRLPKPSAE